MYNILINSCRPRHKDINWREDGFDGEHMARDCFLIDFENTDIEHFKTEQPEEDFPTGPERYKDEEWAAIIKKQVYPHRSDVDWSEYTAWVFQGGGDEWFTGDH